MTKCKNTGTKWMILNKRIWKSNLGGIIKTSMFGILISFITHIFGKGTYELYTKPVG